MQLRPTIATSAGALLVISLALIGSAYSAAPLAQRMDDLAKDAIAQQGGRGITARFATNGGAPSRHPLLRGGTRLDDGTRAKVAEAISAIPGVGGVRWADGSIMAERQVVPIAPMHCQEDVEALLAARTLRFEEASSAIDPASEELLDEVAAALRPCLGSIIAIDGHTDSLGSEAANIALSKARALAVEQALFKRGIPHDGMRVRGVGSREPIDGLDEADPANRRIEFSVIATVPLAPTPVDTPGAR
ncbi:OmpA family protein [Altererythrobacter confluentis]|uniref:OmpA family protein n=1 Tax=Allopontixanthobacter confluentis TaxID=1849021 RepID=A0A6L7GFF6_9SPHN|nr:OmpA family protein [Allopontixanthobacter confluentis]MXP14659.1 OmpA family protein [Allopontixanthobacter confluentis]